MIMVAVLTAAIGHKEKMGVQAAFFGLRHQVIESIVRLFCRAEGRFQKIRGVGQCLKQGFSFDDIAAQRFKKLAGIIPG